MDLEMPEMSGIEGTRRLKQLVPELKVVVLTVFEQPATILEAICAGADGYLLKKSRAPVDPVADGTAGGHHDSGGRVPSRIRGVIGDLVAGAGLGERGRPRACRCDHQRQDGGSFHRRPLQEMSLTGHRLPRVLVDGTTCADSEEAETTIGPGAISGRPTCTGGAGERR
jgi:CheY-like chemotaxis protein